MAKATSIFFVFIFLFIGWHAVLAQSAIKTDKDLHQTVIIKIKKNFQPHLTPQFQLQSVNIGNSLNSKYEKRGITIKKAFNRKKEDEFSLQSTDAAIKERFDLNDFYSIELQKDQVSEVVAELSKEKWIEYVEVIPRYELLYTPNDTYTAKHWGHEKSKIYDAWDITKGDTGTVIGIIDTGVEYTHPSLKDQMYYNYAERYGLPGVDDDANGYVDDSLGYDFGDMDADPMDFYGHGTEVAGVASARVDDNFGSFGVGFHSRIMPIKILNSSYELVNVWQAMIYAAENGCKVINMSFGRSSGGTSVFEQEIIDYMVKDLDVTIVAAAGNTDANLDYYPASYDNVISVAHSNSSDERVATYSYYVDMLAPGNFIPGPKFNNSTDTYHSLVGSSYASPFVAGAVALVRSYFPDLNAIQVGELLRQTTDDVSDIGRNNIFGKVGKGRLNVYRALTEKDNSPAIRMTKLFTKKESTIFHLGELTDITLGDTLKLWGIFQNYLAPSTNDLKVTLSSNADYISIIDSVFIGGSINTLDSTNNRSDPFAIYIHPEMPKEHTLLFRLDFSDGTYNDYQYFFIQSDLNFNIKINNISLSLSAETRLGNVGTPSDPKGIGFNWNDISMLSEAGLILATPDGKVSDALISDTLNRKADFQTLLSDSIVSYSNTYKEIITKATDKGAAIDPINLEITQKIKGWDESGSENFIIVEYHIQNVDTVPIDTLYVAEFADWDLPTSANLAEWDSYFNAGLVKNADDMYAGIKIMDSTSSYFAFDKTDNPNGNISIKDGFTDEEKLLAAKGGFPKNIAGSLSGEEDVAHLLATTLFDLAPNDIDTIQVVFALANSKEALDNSFLKAAEKLNSDIFQSVTPVVLDTLLCEADSLVISPINGNQFKFYADETLDTLLYTGSAYVISIADTATTFYVTNIDKPIESESIAVKLKTVPNYATFSMPDTIDLEENMEVNIAADFGKNVISWEWKINEIEFNSNISSYTYQLNKVGEYEVKLIFRNDFGCEDSLAKTLVATRGYLNPIEKRINICRGSDLTIQPEKGSNFNFYLKANLDSVIYSGEQLLWENFDGNVQIHAFATDTAYAFYHQIFNTQSQSPTVTIISADTVDSTGAAFVEFKSESTDYHSLIWDFGDGNTSLDLTETSHTYAEAGLYTVSLTAIDTLGCEAISTKEILIRRINSAPETITFEMNPDTLNLLHSDSVTFTTESIGEYAWDFGNGQIGFESKHVVKYDLPGEYRITLTVIDQWGNKKGSASKTLLVIDKIALSIDDHPNSKLKIGLYPNPATQVVNFSFWQVPKEEVCISIYSLDGQLVFKNKYRPTSSDLAVKLPKVKPGMYLVKILLEHESHAMKFIVE